MQTTNKYEVVSPEGVLLNNNTEVTAHGTEVELDHSDKETQLLLESGAIKSVQPVFEAYKVGEEAVTYHSATIPAGQVLVVQEGDVEAAQLLADGKVTPTDMPTSKAGTPIDGTIELAVEWKEGTPQDERDALAPSFHQLLEEAEAEFPASVESITIRRIKA